MEKLIDIFKKVGYDALIGKSGISLKGAYIGFDANTVVIHYNINCAPDVASKISLLVFTYCKAYDKEFEFGSVYTAKLDFFGVPESIVFGEEAEKVYKENVKRKQYDKEYYDYLMENNDIEGLHSC